VKQNAGGDGRHEINLSESWFAFSFGLFSDCAGTMGNIKRNSVADLPLAKRAKLKSKRTNQRSRFTS
jgi:hypothetical protein